MRPVAVFPEHFSIPIISETNLAPGRFANVMVPRGVLALTLTRLEILRITGQEEGWIFRAEVRWNSYLRFLRYAHQQDATAYERRRRIALFVFLSFLVLMPAVENLDKVAILFIISCFSVEFSLDKIPITVTCICISTWVLMYLYTNMRMRVKKKKKKSKLKNIWISHNSYCCQSPFASPE